MCSCRAGPPGTAPLRLPSPASSSKTCFHPWILCGPPPPPLFSRRLSGATVLKGLSDFSGLWSPYTPAMGFHSRQIEENFP